jgi:hypothetical protein
LVRHRLSGWPTRTSHVCSAGRNCLEVFWLSHDAVHCRAQAIDKACSKPPISTRLAEIHEGDAPLSQARQLRLGVLYRGRFLQLFDMIVPLTGGPSNSTQTFLYSFGVMRMQVGFGSAVGVVLFIICVTLAFSYKRFMKK